MRSLPPLSLADFETQPFRIRGSAEFDANPDQVFVELGDPSLWFPMMKRSVWKTGATSGVGAEREIDNRLLGKARERMLAWDPGKRVAFTMIAVTSGLVSAMGEEWLISPASGDRTRLSWHVVATPTRIGRLIAPALRVSMKAMFTRGAANIGKRAAVYKPGKKVS